MSRTMNALFHLPLVGRSRAKRAGGGQTSTLSPHPIRLRGSRRYAGSTSPQGGGERHTVALTGGISQ